jgi:hypothetical protein
MKNKITLLIAVFTGCVCSSNANILMVNQAGVGVRAYSFANNYVALSNDLSGIFWNPAALSFMPVREFQVSTDIVRNFTTTDLYGTEEKTGVQRVRLDNIGYLSSVPTSRGGLTFAGAYQSPYIFDDNPSFSGTYSNTSGQTVQVDRNYRSYGNLNYGSGAFGVQIAQGFGIGASFSMVWGTENIKNLFYKLTDGIISDNINDDYNDHTVRDYLGYDIRLGLMYTPNEDLKLGFRLVLPQTIWFDESLDETYPHSSNTIVSYSWNGTLKSSYSGAFGASYAFKYFTLSSELRFRAPYDFIFPDEEIPSGSIAHRTNLGGGLGAELPLGKTNMLLRGGYSYDQYDPYLFVKKYDDESSVDWSTDGFNIDSDRNLVTAGLAYVANSWCIEGGYGCQFWKVNTNETLKEKHVLHRFMMAFSLRY